MSVLEKFYKLVENAIQRLGVDIKDCRTDEPNKWFLHRGKADIVVFVRESQLHTDTKVFTLVMLSPIITLPENADKAQQLKDKLLATNHLFISERFSIADNVVYLASTALMDGITEPLAANLLDGMTYYAQGFAAQFDLEYGDGAFSDSDR
jgi:hypothetical protein